MFWDELCLISETIHKHGLRTPMVDLGGQAQPILAEYCLENPDSDIYFPAYLRLGARPFDHIDPNYIILNPENGDPPIERLADRYRRTFGTVVCTSVLEHVENPVAAMQGMTDVLAPGGLAIVSTVLEYPIHGERDLWRFTPECLRMLAGLAGLNVLDADTRLKDLRVRHRDGTMYSITSVYLIASKGALSKAMDWGGGLPPVQGGGRTP